MIVKLDAATWWPGEQEDHPPYPELFPGAYRDPDCAGRWLVEIGTLDDVFRVIDASRQPVILQRPANEYLGGDAAYVLNDGRNCEAKLTIYDGYLE